MPNRRLTEEQLVEATRLLDEIRADLDALSDGDAELRFAFNRKIAKELGYDERGKPMERKKLKDQKWKAQRGKCAKCNGDLPEKGAVLDRLEGMKGYTPENTQLLCHPCDAQQQAERGYA